MAEGYEFENPTFDDEDIDKDIDEEPELLLPNRISKNSD